jgi:hypothetical protein
MITRFSLLKRDHPFTEVLDAVKVLHGVAEVVGSNPSLPALYTRVLPTAKAMRVKFSQLGNRKI